MDYLMLRLGGIMMVASLLCATKGFAQQAKGSDNMKDAQLVDSATRMLVMADFFRTQAMTNSAITVSRICTDTFAKKWQTEISSKAGGRPEMVLSDFFAGSVALMGGITKEKGIVGFYNPWTDGILLASIRVKGADAPTMDDFVFVTGESFRGTPLTKGSSLLSLYRPDKPLLVELAVRYEKTARMFEKRYPLHGEAVLAAPDLKAIMHPQEVEWAYLLARQSYRMTMFAALTKQENRPLYLQMGKLLRSLDGDMKDLDKTVSAKQRPAALESIKLLPLELRKKLAPHYIVQAKDGAIIGFVNPEFPRWVVIANLKGPAASERDVTIEAFDLETSKGIAALLKGGK